MKTFSKSECTVLMHTIQNVRHQAAIIFVHFHDQLPFCIAVWGVGFICTLTKKVKSFKLFIDLNQNGLHVHVAGTQSLSPSLNLI